jgi:hypothetical protein
VYSAYPSEPAAPMHIPKKSFGTSSCYNCQASSADRQANCSPGCRNCSMGRKARSMVSRWENAMPPSSSTGKTAKSPNNQEPLQKKSIRAADAKVLRQPGFILYSKLVLVPVLSYAGTVSHNFSRSSLMSSRIM